MIAAFVLAIAMQSPSPADPAPTAAPPRPTTPVMDAEPPTAKLTPAPTPTTAATSATTAATAGAAGAAGAAATTTTASVAGAKIPIVLLTLHGEGVDAGTATALTGMVAADIDDIGVLSVVTDEDVKRVLDAEKLRVLLACNDEAKCLSDFKGALGARHLVTGSVAKSESKLVVSLTLLDLDTVSTLSRVQAEAYHAIALGADVKAAVGKLLAPLLATHTGTLAVTSNEEGAVVSVDGAARGTAPLKTSVSAGTHRIEAVKDGFITGSVDVTVPPGSPRVVQVVIVPSADLAASQRQLATILWAGAGTAAGLGVASLATGVGLWSWQTVRTDELAKNALTDGGGRVLIPAADYAQITGTRFAAYTLMAASVPLVATGVLLFFSTDPPWKYDALLDQAAPAPASTPSSAAAPSR